MAELTSANLEVNFLDTEGEGLRRTPTSILLNSDTMPSMLYSILPKSGLNLIEESCCINSLRTIW